MCKRLFKHVTVVLAALCILSLPMLVFAGTVPGQDSGGGGGGGGGSTTSDPHPAYSTFSPNVTVIHNVNVLAAESAATGDESNDDVYYIPTLEDLPFDLKDYVQTRTIKSNGKPRSFAYVYDGYYDSEANLSAATNKTSSDSTSYSSTSVATGSISNPILKKIGYDMLLVQDNYTVNNVGGNLVYSNKSITAGVNPLKADEAVMDIYKALGKFEYKVDVAFIRDKNWEVNSSPILSELSVLTSQSGDHGLNISESYAGVAISRTIPDLYWQRLIRDGVLSGVNKGIGNGSLLTTSQISGGSSKNISMMEFLNTLVALMNLYGEEALDDGTYQYSVSTSASQLANISSRTEDDRTVITYLIAKGILDPNSLSDIDLDGPVYLLSEYMGKEAPNKGNVIIDILSRVADPDKRLPIPKSYPKINRELAVAGYGEIDIKVNPDIYGYTEVLGDFATFYDFLIEVNDVNANKAQVGISNSGTASEDANTSREEYTATANMRIFADGVEIAPMAITDELKATDQNMYLYYGVHNYGGVDYYHFKVHPGLFSGKSQVYFGYATDSPGEIIKSTNNIVLPNLDGGVYRYSGSSIIHSNFEYAGFTEEFVDKDSYSGPLSADWTLITFYIKQNNISNKLKDWATDDQYFNWNELRDNSGQKILTNTSKYLLKSGSFNAAQAKNYETYAYVTEPIGTSEYYRFQITTKAPSLIKNSPILRGLSSSDKEGDLKGFYRASDGSLMVSTAYLRSKDLIGGVSQLSDDVYVLDGGTSTKMNITICKSKSNPYIIVGDTFYKGNDGETLICKDGDTTYINYRACLGWSKDFALVMDGNVAIATQGLFGTITRAYTEPTTTTSINEFFPSSTTHSIKLTLPQGSYFEDLCYNIDGKHEQREGLLLSGSYPLSPYLLVMSDDNNDVDYLFVWHLNNVADSAGTTYVISDDEDENARNEFKKQTGINLPALDNYKLKCYQLLEDNQGRTNPKNLYYLQKDVIAKSGASKATMGWYWIPPKYANCQTALDDYAKSAGGSTELILPIFAYQKLPSNKIYFYDANVNVCSKDSGASYLSVGQLPYYFKSSRTADKEKLATISSSGSLTLSDAGEDTSNYTLHPAPVSLFSQVKAMGSSKIGNVNNGTIYYGTSLVNNKRGTVTINSKSTSFNKDTKLVRNYTSNGSSAIYAILADGTSLGALLSDIDTELQYMIDDPASLVDWDRFKFNRLIENLDSMSTVVLIFVLNIMPTVGMSLFFILMILSLIKDFPFWRKFCNRWFDIYSFLTLGHITVDTIDTKRIFLISLACFSLFMLIMNGTLFNFILFIARLIVEIYQR